MSVTFRLLSPASASYGRYRNFRERGDQFQAEVRKRLERLG